MKIAEAHPQLIVPDPPAPTQGIRVAGNCLDIFVESHPLIEAMAGAIDAAQQRVWLETYIFFHDDAGDRIADALRSAARRGVDVRVLYDAIGSQATSAAFFSDLARAGVQVHAYHSLGDALRGRFLQILNRRDHRKILVVDDNIAFFGGMNIVANEPRRGQTPEKKPMSSGWRDVHIRLAGPQQHEIAESFDRSWRTAHGAAPDKTLPKALRKKLLQGDNRMEGESIRFYDSGPGKKFSRAARVYAALFTLARERIILSIAYFLPVGQAYGAMLSANRRGVRIRVVIPQKSDVRLVQYATSYLFNKLLARGIRIYERKDRMLHSKTMVVDETYTLVGSCNLDPRSLYINLEFMAVIRSTAFAQAITRIARHEIEHSDRVTRASLKRATPWLKFLSMLAWSLRWWL